MLNTISNPWSVYVISDQNLCHIRVNNLQNIRVFLSDDVDGCDGCDCFVRLEAPLFDVDDVTRLSSCPY